MKKLLSGLQSKTYTFKDVLWLLIPALLLIVLPLFLWAAVNQRIEIRKRAASYPPPGTNPTIWMTDNVSLTADNFYIYTNGGYYWGNSSDVQVHSDPGNPGYTTLEIIWHEQMGWLNNQPSIPEMRVFIYFKSDGNTWWADEIRTYNGEIPGDWVYYYGKFFEKPLGEHFTGTIDLTSSPGSSSTGRLHFGNMRLLPFLKTIITPCWNEVGGSGDDLYWRNGCRGMARPGQMCTEVILPLTDAEKQLYRQWIEAGRPPIPGCGPVPTIIPGASPTPPPGCYYQQVQCIQAPCYPILVCPTPTPGLCAMTNPTLTVTPSTQTGTPGSERTYTLTLKSNDAGTCTPRTYALDVVTPGTWYDELPISTMTLSAGQSKSTTFMVRSPSTAMSTSFSQPVLVKATRQDLLSPVEKTVYYVVSPTSVFDQTLDFRFKYAGVTGDGAKNSKITVHVVTQSRNLVTSPIPVTYLGNGIYSVQFKPNPIIPPGEKVYFLLKGEKHAAAKFCLQSGQTNPCSPNVWISMPNIPNPVFTFTGMPLRPGDVYIQNYVTDNADFNKIRALLNKPSTQLSANDLMIGDLNYDLKVNTIDIQLIRQTLDTHFDPS